MPKLVQICSAMVTVPVMNNPLDPRMGTSVQLNYQVYALDEEGHAWELVRPAGVDRGKWVPMTREFATVPDVNGSPVPTPIIHKGA